MCNHYSSLECENILSADMNTKDLINSKEYIEQ